MFYIPGSWRSEESGRSGLEPLGQAGGNRYVFGIYKKKEKKREKKKVYNSNYQYIVFHAGTLLVQHLYAMPLECILTVGLVK